jgi:hypothetical protein
MDCPQQRVWVVPHPVHRCPKGRKLHRVQSQFPAQNQQAHRALMPKVFRAELLALRAVASFFDQPVVLPKQRSRAQKRLRRGAKLKRCQPGAVLPSGTALVQFQSSCWASDGNRSQS